MRRTIMITTTAMSLIALTLNAGYLPSFDGRITAEDIEKWSGSAISAETLYTGFTNNANAAGYRLTGLGDGTGTNDAWTGQQITAADTVVSNGAVNYADILAGITGTQSTNYTDYVGGITGTQSTNYTDMVAGITGTASSNYTDNVMAGANTNGISYLAKNQTYTGTKTFDETLLITSSPFWSIANNDDSATMYIVGGLPNAINAFLQLEGKGSTSPGLAYLRSATDAGNVAIISPAGAVELQAASGIRFLSTADLQGRSITNAGTFSATNVLVSGDVRIGTTNVMTYIDTQDVAYSNGAVNYTDTAITALSNTVNYTDWNAGTNSLITYFGGNTNQWFFMDGTNVVFKRAGSGNAVYLPIP
jgi:hypothetical protein